VSPTSRRPSAAGHYSTLVPETREAGVASKEAPRGSLEPVTIRHVTGWAEYQACVALQQEVWGMGFADTVPAAILKVSQRLGGVTAGAFDASGRLIGFVFGITGVERGQLVHWSDMLGVLSEARDHGLGRRLKAFQRDAVRALGVSVIYWTYDPLVARNAYLNLVQFGTEVTEYVPNFYGAQTSSALHQGLGTDRFVVAWHVGDSPRPPRPAVPPLDSPEIPVINGTSRPSTTAARVRVAIPLQIDQIQRTSLAQATQWRAETRPAFQWALSQGYRIVGFQRDDAQGRGLYELQRG